MKTPRTKAARRSQAKARLQTDATPVCGSGKVSRLAAHWRAARRIAPAAVLTWTDTHVDWLAVVVVAIGFFLRLRCAEVRFLSPDEALPSLAVANGNMIEVLVREAQLSPYPPLHTLVLYLFSLLNKSELWLRLPSVLSGTAFLWLAFRWMKLALGAAAAWAGLILLTFSPPMIVLSAEVRAYAFQMFWMAGALYFLERAFAGRPARNLCWSGLWLWLSILSHYQAFWFTLAAGVYGLLRILGRDLPARAIRVWAAVQIATLGLCLFLYKVHLARFHGEAMEQLAVNGWLRGSYFHGDGETPLAFIRRSTEAFFGYFINPESLGAVAALLFLAGMALLVWRWMGHGERRAAALAVLLVLPFAVSCAAALRRLYPYGGSRHSSYLALFAAAGMGIAPAAAARRRVAPLLLAAAVAVPVWSAAAQDRQYDIAARNQRKELMTAAIAYLRQSVDPGGRIFADAETAPLVEYYLGHRARDGSRQTPEGFFEETFAGYRMLVPNSWSPSARELQDWYIRMRKQYHLKPDEVVWVIDAGASPAVRYDSPVIGLRNFGDNITVFRYPAAVDQLAATAP